MKTDHVTPCFCSSRANIFPSTFRYRECSLYMPIFVAAKLGAVQNSALCWVEPLPVSMKAYRSYLVYIDSSYIVQNVSQLEHSKMVRPPRAASEIIHKSA